MFSYFAMFGVSLFKIEYLTQIERKIEKSKIISSMIEAFERCSFITEYVSENLRFCESGFFILASEYGNLEVVKMLLKDPRIDPSAYNKEAIRVALRNERLEVVKLLLQDPRVDPSAKDNEAIRYASDNGQLEVVKLLLQDQRVDHSATDNQQFDIYPWDLYL